MYGGYLEGMPTLEHNIGHVAKAVKLAKDYYPNLEPFIYRGDLNENEILPAYVNIAWLDDMDNHMMLIWFTDGKKDIIEGLNDIIDNIDWDKNSIGYCW